MEELAVRLLKERNLKITPKRILVLNALLQNTSKAYSFSELLKPLTGKMNRSTIYRSLDTLLENDLITKMIDINGDIIYTLNFEEKCEHKLHPHLKCDQCGVLECLPAFPQNYASLLQQSGVDKLNIVLGGTCSNCLVKKKDA